MSWKKATAQAVSAGKAIYQKGKVLAIGATVGVGNLMAADAPVVPTTELKADYGLFDWVFAGVVTVAFVFMVARRSKGFVR